MSAARTLRGGHNLLTPHPDDAYPGLLVVRCGPEWNAGVIVPQDGQAIVGLGGERLLGYELRGGTRAEGFELGPGDRAVRVRSDLPHSLAEWRIEPHPGAAGTPRPG